MKKIFFTLLLASLLFAAVACNGATEEIFDVQFVSEAEDLDGYVFRYIQNDTSVFGYVEDSFLSEQALARVKEVEEKLKCKIEIDYTGSSNVVPAVFNSIAASDKPYDLVYSDDGAFVGLTRGGYLLDLALVVDTINYYDYEKWGLPGELESMMYEGRLYGVRNKKWLETYTTIYAPLVFNGELFRLAGLEDPREAVENGLWTREYFEQVLNDTTFINGSTQIYGMAVSKDFMLAMAMCSNDCSIIAKDSAGKYISGYETQKAYEALSWVDNLYTRFPGCFSEAEGAGWDAYHVVFLDGRAAMHLYPLWGIYGGTTTPAYLMADFGLLPYPLGPELEYGDWRSYVEGSPFLSIPANVEEPETSAVIIDALFEPFPGYETEEDALDYYAGATFHDRRDVELLFKMIEKARYNYWKEDSRAVLSMLLNDSLTITEAIQKSSEHFVTYTIEEFAAPNQELYEALYANYIEKEGLN